MTDYLFETNNDKKGLDNIETTKRFLKTLYGNQTVNFYVVHDCQEDKLRFFALHDGNTISYSIIKMRTDEYNRVHNKESNTWIEKFLKSNTVV